MHSHAYLLPTSCAPLRPCAPFPAVFGVNFYYRRSELDPSSPLYDPSLTKSVSAGMEFTWLKNTYNWKFFAVRGPARLGAGCVRGCAEAAAWRVWGAWGRGCLRPSQWLLHEGCRRRTPLQPAQPPTGPSRPLVHKTRPHTVPWLAPPLPQVPIGVSTGAMIMFAVLNYLWARCGRAKPAVLGFVAPATHPELNAGKPPPCSCPRCPTAPHRPTTCAAAWRPASAAGSGWCHSRGPAFGAREFVRP